MLSEGLKRFLSEWLAWAEADAPPHPIFKSSLGLCTNVMNWAECQADEHDWNAYRELKQVFHGELFPFGEARYERDMRLGIQHRNEARLAWVREKLYG